MFRFVISSMLVAMAMAQGYHPNPQTAAIISEQRYLSGDGKFGAAYTQEDGINFKEETDSDGTRHGSYSYVDPSGQRRTISYTAGKNGFQAAGDHLPVAPPAPPQPAPTPGYQPLSQYQPPAPQHNHGGNNYDDDGSYDPRHNDPGYGQDHRSAPAAPAYHQPAPAPAYQQPAPQPAYYNHNFQHEQQQSSYNPPQQQYNPPQQQYNNNPPQYTTPNPHRFQPPGKLSLNRTPDGFSYSFNKVK